ncbi:MAG: hypothetical protein JXP34_25510 [Planctomycetes bacterium]|nr:hypothetical protein [Planctomycetota bacterium]
MNPVALICLLSAGLAPAAAPSSAEPTDFDMRIEADRTTVHGEPGQTISTLVRARVLLTTRVHGLQGWSFGIRTEADDGVRLSVVGIEATQDVLTVDRGGHPFVLIARGYREGQLAAPAWSCSPDCDGVDAAAVTQGLVICSGDFYRLPEVEDFEMLDLTLRIEGLVPDRGPLGEPVGPPRRGRLVFTDEVGDPAVVTGGVWGGGTILPAVQEGVEIRIAPCARPSPFTIEVEGGWGERGDRVQGAVFLDFDADPRHPNGDGIYGWAYGICIRDPEELAVVGATIEGTGTARVKGGGPPDFDGIEISDRGLLHAVVVDVRMGQPLSPRNRWHDLNVTYEILAAEVGDGTYVVPCSGVLGDPPFASAMTLSGTDVEASTSDGIDPEEECCDPRVCNRAGRFVNAAAVALVPGDANGDGRLDIADGIYTLSFLFRSGARPPCMAAADFDANGRIDLSDAVASVVFQLAPTAGQPGGGWPGPAWGLGCRRIERDATALSCDRPRADCP